MSDKTKILFTKEEIAAENDLRAEMRQQEKEKLDNFLLTHIKTNKLESLDGIEISLTQISQAYNTFIQLEYDVLGKENHNKPKLINNHQVLGKIKDFLMLLNKDKSSENPYWEFLETSGLIRKKVNNYLSSRGEETTETDYLLDANLAMTIMSNLGSLSASAFLLNEIKKMQIKLENQPNFKHVEDKADPENPFNDELFNASLKHVDLALFVESREKTLLYSEDLPMGAIDRSNQESDFYKSVVFRENLIAWWKTLVDKAVFPIENLDMNLFSYDKRNLTNKDLILMGFSIVDTMSPLYFGLEHVDIKTNYDVRLRNRNLVYFSNLELYPTKRLVTYLKTGQARIVRKTKLFGHILIDYETIEINYKDCFAKYKMIFDRESIPFSVAH